MSERITVPGTQSLINIENLHPATAYHIRIAAENKLGSSEYSEVVQVTTLEEAPSGAPLNVRGEAKSSTEIILTWDPPNKNDWNGNLLGYYVGYQAASDLIGPTQGFNLKTVEIRAHFGFETVLENLNKFTQYNLFVQAYTSQGSGPPSKEIQVTTLEDGTLNISMQFSFFRNLPIKYVNLLKMLLLVPSSPPESPKCDVLSSTSIYITWSPPPSDSQNGKVRGYKVFYIATDEIYDKEMNVVKSNNQYLTVENLKKYTNYSIWVLAYTKVGDGVKTKQLFCRTYEDGK